MSDVRKVLAPMLSVRTCPHCGAVCSITGTLCATCGLDTTLAAEGQVPVVDLRPAATSRGVWNMVVDALLHGSSLARFGRRKNSPAVDVNDVMQTHVVEPGRRAAVEPADERIDHIA